MAGNELKIFILSHKKDVLDRVPNLGYFEKLDLSVLPLGQYQDNRLGEGRAFLADLKIDNAAYLGFLNGRLPQKYPKLKWNSAIKSIQSQLKPENVLFAWGAASDWANFSEKVHPGIKKVIQELADFTGLKLTTGRISLWANDFICHRKVWLEWREFWKKCFFEFHKRYNWNFSFSNKGLDPNRKPAYFYERITTLYFANRPDLRLCQI